MAETLRPGAMPEDWQPPADPPSPHAEHWFPTGTPGGAKVDPHPHDAPAGFYDTPPAPTNEPVPDALHRSRINAHGASPLVFRMTNCARCQCGITYYGRADQAPEVPLCPDCANDPANADVVSGMPDTLPKPTRRPGQNASEPAAPPATPDDGPTTRPGWAPPPSARGRRAAGLAGRGA